MSINRALGIPPPASPSLAVELQESLLNSYNLILDLPVI